MIALLSVIVIQERISGGGVVRIVGICVAGDGWLLFAGFGKTYPVASGAVQILREFFQQFPVWRGGALQCSGLGDCCERYVRPRTVRYIYYLSKRCAVRFLYVWVWFICVLQWVYADAVGVWCINGVAFVHAQVCGGVLYVLWLRDMNAEL